MHGYITRFFIKSEVHHAKVGQQNRKGKYYIKTNLKTGELFSLRSPEPLLQNHTKGIQAIRYLEAVLVSYKSMGIIRNQFSVSIARIWRIQPIKNPRKNFPQHRRLNATKIF